MGGWTGPQVWKAESVFDRIIPVPVISPATPLTSKDAYLGTPVRHLSLADLTDALGTLAGFDVIVSIQHGLAHTLTGHLRKLQVEAWALLGRELLDAGSAAAGQRLIGPVTACAAFEHAYQRIIALDPQTLDLCRAVGIPADKLCRWGDAPAESTGGWERCPPLELVGDRRRTDRLPNRGPTGERVHEHPGPNPSADPAVRRRPEGGRDQQRAAVPRPAPTPAGPAAAGRR